jgi:predicted nuclease of predicted toxin-antitoxin system
MMLLVDAQLPRALATWLTSQGLSARHVFELLPRTAEDSQIWNLAHSTGASVITKDEDFIGIRVRAGCGPSVVWLRIGNTTNDVLIAWLAPRLPRIVAQIEMGTAIIEVK